MPRFRVRVRQYVEEVAEKIIIADNEQEARDQAEDEDDWDWYDGTDSGEFEITKIEPMDDPENELGGHLGDD